MLKCKTPSQRISKTSFVTYSGQILDLNNVEGWRINIEDIAEALSKQGRFNGHTAVFYSVAQHSVVVSKAIRKEIPVHKREDKKAKQLQLYGLLHDAAEAYIGDIITPVKKFFLQNSHELEDLETLILNKVFETVGLEPLSKYPKAAQAVKTADRLALTTEMRDLFKDGVEICKFAGGKKALASRIIPQNHFVAMENWLNLFEKLTDINPRTQEFKKAS